MSQFSNDGKRAAKALTHLWETGEFVGDPSALVIDTENSAGITYGKSQVIEVNGGLWNLLFVDYPQTTGAQFVDELEPYKERLYKKGSDRTRNALSGDTVFHELLRKIGREDSAMSAAQDMFFHKNYFVHALAICEEFSLTLPLSLAFVYDFCIHSGPGTQFNDGKTLDLLNEWDEDYNPPETDDDTEAEKQWTIHMCNKRDVFLYSIKRARYTRYRTGSMLKLMKEGGSQAWNLEVPLDITFLRKGYTGYPDRHLTLTQKELNQIPLL